MGPGARTDLGVSKLDADCATATLDDDRLVCSAFDGTRRRIVALDQSGRVTPITSLPGRFISHGRAGSGWLTGWSASTPVALRLSTRQAVRVPVIMATGSVR